MLADGDGCREGLVAEFVHKGGDQRLVGWCRWPQVGVGGLPLGPGGPEEYGRVLNCPSARTAPARASSALTRT